MSKHRHTASPATPLSSRRRKMLQIAENAAALGMLLICAGLMIPLFNLTDPYALAPFKWMYAAGTLIYIVARVVSAADRKEPMRLRRLRRMEFWAGVCFMAGAAFWFYREQHLGPTAGPLAVVNNTILFTLACALIQIIASWLIYSQEKKLNKEKVVDNDKKK